MSQKDLTDRQQQILDFINEFRAREQKPPTRAEIARHFGFKSGNAAQEHLEALARKGCLRITRGESRGIFVVPQPLPSAWPQQEAS